MSTKRKRHGRYQPRYAAPRRRNLKGPAVIVVAGVAAAATFVPSAAPPRPLSITGSSTGTIPGMGPYTVGTVLTQTPFFQDPTLTADSTSTSVDPTTTLTPPTSTSLAPITLAPSTTTAPTLWLPSTTVRPRRITAPTSPPTTENSGYGCAAALAYLRQYANPIYELACPASADGHTAVTCYHCYMYPNVAIIAIARPCRIAYMNEAWNSWHLGILGQPYGPIDPYGQC